MSSIPDIPGKLYHGTTAQGAEIALSQGLVPSGDTGVNNYDDFPSNPKMVYLTDVYATWYALFAVNVQFNCRRAIVEIDTSLLSNQRLCVDEDFLVDRWQEINYQQIYPDDPTYKKNESPFSKEDIREAINHYQQGQDQTQDLAASSLHYRGTIAHNGPISKAAISRVIFFDDHPSLDLLKPIQIIRLAHESNYPKFKAINDLIIGAGRSSIRVSIHGNGGVIDRASLNISLAQG